MKNVCSPKIISNSHDDTRDSCGTLATQYFHHQRIHLNRWGIPLSHIFFQGHQFSFRSKFKMVNYLADLELLELLKPFLVYFTVEYVLGIQPRLKVKKQIPGKTSP